jgi:soluble lytic murein transglycosylase-like protein
VLFPARCEDQGGLVLNPSTVSVQGGTTQQAEPAHTALHYRMIARRFASLLHKALLFFGVVAIAALVAVFFNPSVADHLKALSPFADEAVGTADASEAPIVVAVNVTPPLLSSILPPAQNLSVPATQTPIAAQAADFSKVAYVEPKQALRQAANREEQRVSHWLSKRYRVASDATRMMVSSAYQTARELKIDPLLVLAVVAIESRFNPFAESPVGAQGLMQVMSKVHHDKFKPLGGVEAALNPVANIRVGSLILKDYVTRGGSVEAGLKRYVGAAALDTDFGYGEKVLGEYRRLKDVASGKKVPIFVAAAKPAAAKPKVQNIPLVSEPKPSAQESPVEAEAKTPHPLNVDIRQSESEAEPFLLSS